MSGPMRTREVSRWTDMWGEDTAGTKSTWDGAELEHLLSFC